MSQTGSVNKQVLVALSGGMDSTYAAWTLKSQGYEVLGVHFRLDPFASVAAESEDALDIDQAPRTEGEQRLVKSAEKTGVQVLFVELGRKFRHLVLEPFLEEYKRGRTPNPCVVCNAKIKFASLLDLADRLGAAFYATGHYARVIKHPESGTQVVCQALDPKKDQSYFLCRVPSSHLERCLMPLGEMTKGQVRAAVLKLGILGPAVRPSQDLCFAKDGYKALFKRLAYSSKPGPIVDVELGLVGRHEGIMNFTIGQRRGLSIALGKPKYVLSIQPATNTVLIGDKKHVYARQFRASDVVWADGLAPKGPAFFDTKIRYRHKAQEAQITPIDGNDTTVSVRFDQAQPSITPGQAVTFYDGDCVVGAGWIEQVART
ncbi:MAG TPA: tRNA 2-thiouridine(34) synthase MnmA [bacterium]|nr:tRNA 2-thiouridine(34) synthase MnmA [bacterium]